MKSDVIARSEATKQSIFLKNEIASVITFPRNDRSKKQSLFLYGFALISILISFVSLSSAKNYYGLPSDYLQYGAGARSLAMGGAYVGLSDDASATYWNPAAISLLDDYQLMTMYAPFFESTQYNFISAILPLGPLGGIGISDTMLYSKGFEERDRLNMIMSSNQSILQNAFVATYGYRMRNLSWGINLKLLQEKNFGISGSGNGLDLGLLYSLGNRLNIGLVYLNVWRPEITLVEQKNIYGRILKTGVAVQLLPRKFIVTLDATKAEQEEAYYTAGTEISFWRDLSFRAGFNQQTEFTYGLGLRINPLTVDYAYSGHELGNLHKVTLTLKWGNIYQATAKPLIKSQNGIITLQGLHNELVFDTDIPHYTVKNWLLEIKDSRNNLVRSLSGELVPPEKIVWDMLDQEGRPIKQGNYRTNFVVNYKNGKVWQESRHIKFVSPTESKNEVEMELIGQPKPAPQREQETTDSQNQPTASPSETEPGPTNPAQ